MERYRLYPLDFSALRKGSLITNDQLEQILGVNYKERPEEFRLKTLGLQARIHDTLGFTALIKRDGLRILTDSEAQAVNHNRFGRHLRGARRRHELALEVDPVNLTEEERHSHDESLIRESRILNSIRSELRKVTMEERATLLPKMRKEFRQEKNNNEEKKD